MHQYNPRTRKRLHEKKILEGLFCSIVLHTITVYTK